MEQFLLASHGSLARAMKETAAFLLGTNENVHCLCAYVDEASMNLEPVSYTHLYQVQICLRAVLRRMSKASRYRQWAYGVMPSV